MRIWVELAANLIEAFAVLIMAGFIFAVTIRWGLHLGRQQERAFESYRSAIGRALLLGLELLVAADIIRTVVLGTTLINIATLAALVLVRTFLGWTLTVEIEGRWPWQKPKDSA